MGLLDLFKRSAGDAGHALVHVVIKGRIGEGWLDVDERLKVPVGTTLAELVELAAARGVPLGKALRESPHLAHTMMLNGERCPFDENAARKIESGDEIYLLAPLAGG